MKNVVSLLFTTFILLILAGCNQSQNRNPDELKQALRQIGELEKRLEEVHIPGWGETMRGSTQMHHSNLWFAGVAKNWGLAEHMVEEIEEGFEKLENWYPNDERTAALPIINNSLKKMNEAIAKKDQEAFRNGYSDLTISCNSCHNTTGNEIYVIQIPTHPGFTNLRFEVQENE